MEAKKRRFTLDKKMYLFIFTMIFFTVASVCLFSYVINVSQIDGYFKQLTLENAQNVASLVDADFYKELRALAETEDYQAIRDQAEEADDEELVINYLQEQGVWDKYQEERNRLIKYIENMQSVKYLYVIAWGDKDAMLDMYLMDADDVPVYETGYYEEREEEFAGMDPQEDIPPVISNGDWGWLCSGYARVYDDEGNLICHVGCDVGMDDIIQERRENLNYVIMSAFFCMIIVLMGAFLFVNKAVVQPLKSITKEMKKFSPTENAGYKDAGVINLELESNDEISDIYQEIHSMQTRIVDYIQNITAIRRDKEKAEDDARNKEEMIGKISEDAYKDALTGIGNKAAYVRRITELNDKLRESAVDFAVVMIDVNCLKIINDHYGHTAGDNYLKGISHKICDIYKHSPVFRIGGDEFVVILTGEDYENRQEKLKNLREMFDQSYHQTDVEPWQRFSAAAGMAERASQDETVELVFRRADQYMYEEKLKFKKENDLTMEVR